MINAQVKPSVQVPNFSFTHLNFVKQGVIYECCVGPDLNYLAEKKWTAEVEPYILVFFS